MLWFLKNIMQLVLHPVNGWKDISADDRPVDELAGRGLYPLLAVLLLSVFVRPIYGFMTFDLVLLLQVALIEFVALFASMWLGRAVMEHYLPRYNATGDRDDIGAGTVAVYVTGVMAVIAIIENLLPVDLVVMNFLPAFAAIVLWKSAAYLDIEERYEGSFMLLAVASTIVPVICINLVMSYLLN